MARSGIFKLAIDTMFSIRATGRSRGRVGVNGGGASPRGRGCHGLEQCRRLPRRAPRQRTMRSGTHTQAVDDELAACGRALPFKCWEDGISSRTTCSSLRLTSGGVFDGDDGVGVWRMVRGKELRTVVLLGAGASEYDDVEAAFDHGGEQFEHGSGSVWSFPIMCAP